MAILGENQQDSKKLEKALVSLAQVAEKGLPLNESVASGMLINLAINYQVWSKKQVKELELVTMGDAKVVEEHLLVKFNQTIRIFIEKYQRLLEIGKQPEGIVIILSSAIEQVKIREKELLIEILSLIKALIDLIWRQGGKKLIENIFPNTFSSLFNLILNQYREVKSLKSKQIALEILSILTKCYYSYQTTLLESSKPLVNPFQKQPLSPATITS